MSFFWIFNLQSNGVVIFTILSKVYLLYLVDSFQVVDSTKCMLSQYGYKYLIFVCTDLTVSNILEIGIPYIKMKYEQRKQQNANLDLRPEFQVEEEYLELIYRQYIIYNAMIYFPMATLFNLIISLVEVFVDKFRLLNICKLPQEKHNIANSTTKWYQLMLTSALVCIAGVAALSQGIWVFVM